jgi:cyclase
MGQINDAIKLIKYANVDAIAIASVLHYKLESVQNIKRSLVENKIKVRI